MADVLSVSSLSEPFRLVLVPYVLLVHRPHSDCSWGCFGTAACTYSLSLLSSGVAYHDNKVHSFYWKTSFAWASKLNMGFICQRLI